MEQPRNKKELLGVTNALAEIKMSLEGVEDKVSEINQEIEPKRQEMENKRNDKALRRSTQEVQFLTNRSSRKQKDK